MNTSKPAPPLPPYFPLSSSTRTELNSTPRLALACLTSAIVAGYLNVWAARQFSVSSRAPSPSWAIESASPGSNNSNAIILPPLQPSGGPGPYSTSTHKARAHIPTSNPSIPPYLGSEHYQSDDTHLRSSNRPRPRPRDPSVPSATEDPNFFMPRQSLARPAYSQSASDTSARIPTVLVPETQPAPSSAGSADTRTSQFTRTPPHFPQHQVIDMTGSSQASDLPLNPVRPAPWHIVSLQASIGHTRSQPIDLLTPPLAPQTDINQTGEGLARQSGGAGPPVGRGRGVTQDSLGTQSIRGRGCTQSRGRGGATRNKVKQSGVVVDPAEQQSPQGKKATKRPRIHESTEAEDRTILASAAIWPIANISSTGRAVRQDSLWTAEQDLALVLYYFSPSNYNICKENQMSAACKISDVIFKDAVTPDQIQNCIRVLLFKYNVYNMVMNHTGTGSDKHSDHSINNFLEQQGLKSRVSAQSLRDFANSDLFPIMNKVLENNPSVSKDFGLDPSRAVSPDSRADGSSENDTEDAIVVPLDTRSGIAATSSFRICDGIIDLDPTTDGSATPPRSKRSKSQKRQLAEKAAGVDTANFAEIVGLIKQSLLANQDTQGETLKLQQALYKQQINNFKSEANSRDQQQEREDMKIALQFIETQRAHDTATFQRVQEERQAQLLEADQIAKWRHASYNDESTLAMTHRIEAAHRAIPLELLSLQAANIL
ncbi:hypothetical protein RhiJN_09204 [Ceratobasidium sp. AG-Ba]|nr:hypothetical protein RhiJN_09204 [Ceratobasidium sp. AG-Ba]